ncbi:MAG TPA: protein kinase [Kofleriaceae bacterium]|nr:protein kinase [Kofleriaceae bacterium]
MHVCPECGRGVPQAGFCPEDGARLVVRSEDLLLGETLGKFRVARLLGVGGMGRVYRAVQPDIGSRVAIKVLSRECADKRDLVERFFAEARAVNLIRHENIVNVLDLATLPDGRPYIIMEYLDGAPLSAVMQARGPLPMGTMARLTGEVLDALAAAHAQTIVHRDLKPDNIFVTPQGRAKVLDFGIAKLRPEASGRSGPTRTGSLLGTPHYMAPEQAMSRPVDARTDVYAMGVILYEGVTGAKPFVAESLFDLLRKQVEEMPRPARELRPDLPPAFDALITRAMAKDPGARHQSAHELAHALAEATQMLPPNEWIPLRPDSGRVAIGPHSMATPSGSSGPQAFAPTSAATPLPTPQAGQMHTTPEPAQVERASRAPVWIGAGIGLAAIAGAIAFIVVMSAAPEDGSPMAAAGAGVLRPVRQAQGQDARADEAGVLRPVRQAQGQDSRADEAGEAAASKPEAVAATKPAAAARSKASPAASSKPVPPVVNPATNSTPPLATSRFSSFDVTGYLPTALAKARSAFPDAVLVRIDASGVYPDGKADLTLADNFYVLYRFVSPSKAERPADLPIGLEHKPTCKYYVNVSAKGVQAYKLEGWACEEPLIGRPTCSARQVWKKAISDGAPAKNAIGELGYWAGPDGKGRWSFSVGKVYSEWIADDC